ncbi:hypothetical protein, partial [Ralstonia pickettii]|uniref:hypothetical protein n=1 Tax=Ralstonia pickettii TaxID=329 RepID=UPI001C7234CB
LYPEAAAGHGRLVSTSADCGKRGHYRVFLFGDAFFYAGVRSELRVYQQRREDTKTLVYRAGRPLRAA